MSELIERQAAIDAMSETLKRVFPEHRQIAEKCLSVLPPAEPVRHGEWIHHVDSESIGETWICSECNGEEFARTKFCPHCGARMDSDE